MAKALMSVDEEFGARLRNLGCSERYIADAVASREAKRDSSTPEAVAERPELRPRTNVIAAKRTDDSIIDFNVTCSSGHKFWCPRPAGVVGHGCPSVRRKGSEIACQGTLRILPVQG